MDTPEVPPRGPFDASAAAAGYAMQMRYALYLAVQRLQSDLNWQISVEAADDVEIQRDGSFQYLQLKHRAEGTHLTNASSDLWKTLRIWAEALLDGSLDLKTTGLYLITTGNAAPSSVAAQLTDNHEYRNVKAAAQTLNSIAETGQNKTNSKAYEAWKQLDPERRARLLECVTVVPEGPDVDDVLDLLMAQCRLAVRRNMVRAFVTRLEGWWFQRGINVLRSRGDSIRGDELDAQFNDLRESFQPENLPIDWEIVGGSEPDITAFREYRFVRQIDLVGVSTPRIASAIRDYLRAFNQRSRWTRESLVGPDELNQYERRLIEARVRRSR